MSISYLHEVVPDIKEGKKYAWIYKERERIDGIIISPDTDGFLSALLLNVINGWRVVGFYDGKILAILEEDDLNKSEEGAIDLTKYAFIDVEILRPGIPSTGHHMIVRWKENIPELIKSIENICIQPNILRNYDVKNDFKKKYPFGTFHLLLSLLYLIYDDHSAFNFDSESALAPTIYVDGVFKNMFNYPENCLSWLEFLTKMDERNPVIRILDNVRDMSEKKWSLIESMKIMKEFFSTLSDIWGTVGNKQKQGKLNLQEDIHENGRQYALRSVASSALIGYLKYLSDQFRWKFNPALWPVTNNSLHVFHLRKEILAMGAKNYNTVMRKCPVSLAITSTSRKGLEYTVDPHGIFPRPRECYK